MNTNNSLYNIVMNAFAAGRAAGKAEESPDKDTISMRRAIAIFGKGWLDRKIAEGKIHVHRSSFAANAKMHLSLAECRCEKYAETITEIVYKEKHSTKN